MTKARTVVAWALASLVAYNVLFAEGGEKSQIVKLSGSAVAVSEIGQTVSLGLDYDVSDSVKELSGISFRLHFDSSKVAFKSVSGFASYGAAFALQPSAGVEDASDFDGDAETDRYLQFSWADFNNAWPGAAQSLPLRLANVTFEALEGLAEGPASLVLTEAEADPAYSFSGFGAVLSFEEAPKVQSVEVVSKVEALAPGDPAEISLVYSVSDGKKELSGLNLRLFFNSEFAVFSEVTFFEAFGASIFMEPASAAIDSENEDNDESTDRFLQFTWADFNLAWPGAANDLPLTLATIVFDPVDSGFNGSSRFTVLAIDKDPAYEFEEVGLELGYLLLSKSEIVAGAEAQEVLVGFESNLAWTVASGADWLVVTSETSGEGDGVVAFTLASNELPGDRSTEIAIGGQSILVTQSGFAGGFYFSEKPIEVSSARVFADPELASYAGLWLSDDLTEGALLGLCAENGNLVRSFYYQVSEAGEDGFSVREGEAVVATLNRDAQGGLVGDLPCVGEMRFAKVLAEDSSSFAGFYETDSGEESGAKVYVIVAPDRQVIAVAPELAEPLALKGEIGEDGLISLGDEAEAAPKKLRLATPKSGGGISLMSMSVDRDLWRVQHGSETIEVYVASIGSWSVEGMPDWMTASKSSGEGSGTISFDLSENESGLRVAELLIGGEAVVVRQIGNPAGLDFDEWLRAYYLEQEIAAMTPSASDADLDHDQLTNFEEWVLGLDPTSYASRVHLSLSVEEGVVSIEAWPVPADSGVVFERSTDLQEWEPLTGEIEEGVLRATWGEAGNSHESGGAESGLVANREDSFFRLLVNLDDIDDSRSGFALIPAGTFSMGSPDGELGRFSDETQHQVTLTRAFYMAKTEVTWSQWQAVREQATARGYTDLQSGRNGYNGDAGGQHPVTEVNWWSAIKWCNLRSELEGLTPVYYTSASFGSGNVLRTGTATPYMNVNANGYRLPTEAEWEYACRAGEATAFYTGGITHTGSSPVDPNLDLAGWYSGNSGSNTHPVGQKQANAWGLHDMHGNVWEWCWDWYGSNGGNVTDPTGPASGSVRVIRGGSWGDDAQYCRSAFRSGFTPSFTFSFLGFRVARSSVP